MQELNEQQVQAVSGGLLPLIAVLAVADIIIWYHVGKQAGAEEAAATRRPCP